MRKRRQKIAKQELRRQYEYVSKRIERGDLDFDDWLYKTRDAIGYLLGIDQPAPEVEQ